MPRSPEMQRQMERLFPDEMEAVAMGNCPTCKGEIGPFRDGLSKKEYTISGMCQKCQDGVFGDQPEDEDVIEKVVKEKIESYLGDGVYAAWDGYHILLDLRAQDNTTLIAMDPDVIASLYAFHRRVQFVKVNASKERDK